jgi:hypothetical protein
MNTSPEEQARQLDQRYGIGYAKALEIVLEVERVMRRHEED